MKIKGLFTDNIFLICDDSLYWNELCTFLGTKNFDLSISEFLLEPTKFSATNKSIIILCELGQDENGQFVKRESFYGIKLAQSLRRNGLRNPIIFTSFLSRKEVFSKNSQRGIINAIGHSFVQIPAALEVWSQFVYNTRGLNDLELFDIVNSYCIDVGIISTLLHSLYGTPLYDLKDKIKEALIQSHLLFNLDPSFAVKDFQNRFPEIDDSNRKQALNFAEERGNELVEKYAVFESTRAKLKAEGGWKILVLDDEFGEEHNIVKNLIERNLDVICVQSVRAAWEVLEEDFRTDNKILVVVSDYRLEELVDGVYVHQPVQGYGFLKEVSNRYPYLRLVAFSALPRKFLMQSFKHYGVRVDIFSKKDYLENDATLGLLCDELVEIGNENINMISRLPRFSSEQWKLFEPFYLAHRSSVNYKENEFYISRKAKTYCQGIKKNLYVFQLEGFTVSLNGKRKTPSNPKAFSEFKNKMIARRVAIWYSQYNKNWNLIEVLKVLKGVSFEGTETESAAKNQINTNLSLALSDFPWNMTIEEKNWMIFEMGISEIDDIENQEERIRHYVEGKLREWINENSMFQDCFDEYGVDTLARIRKVLNQITLKIHENRDSLDSLIHFVSACKTEISRRMPDKSSRNENVNLFSRFLHILLNYRLRRIKRIPVRKHLSDETWENLQQRITQKALSKVKVHDRDSLRSIAWLFFHELREKEISFADDSIYLEHLLQEFHKDPLSDPRTVSYDDLIRPKDDLDDYSDSMDEEYDDLY